MKSFVKLLFIIFTMVMSFTITPSELYSNNIQPIGYIQTIPNETVEIVSNNILNSEIYSNNEENNQNFSTNSTNIISFNQRDNIFSKNKTHFNGSFIHNLSTNNKKVQQIRAP